MTELLETLKLPPEVYRDRYPHQLSGGQQQRVGVARALAGDPDMLLMDEPFGALDPVTRGALQQEIARIHDASGKTIVLVTHDIDEALRLADRIVVLDRGHVVQLGTPREILSSPANDFVADFVGRSDIGIKLLGLYTVADCLRPDEVAAGSPIASAASLREALSAFVARRVDRIAVVDEHGRPAGAICACRPVATEARDDEQSRGASGVARRCARSARVVDRCPRVSRVRNECAAAAVRRGLSRIATADFRAGQLRCA